MGPRTGSPAAETQYKLFVLLACSMGLCLFPKAAIAETSYATQELEIIVVPPEMGLSESRPSQMQTAESTLSLYRIKNNFVSDTAIEGFLSAQLKDSSEPIRVTASVGSFQSDSPQPEAQLHPVSGNRTLTKSSSVPLLDKGYSNQYQAHSLSGTVPVTWEAKSNSRGSSDDSPIVFVTLTLKDA